MASILILWLVIFVLCSITILSLVEFLPVQMINPNEQCLPTITVFVVMSLAVLSAFSGYISLLMPLGSTNILIIVGLVGFLLYSQRYRIRKDIFVYHSLPRNPYFFTALLLIFLTVGLSSTRAPSIYDTGLYHVQSVRWIEEFRVVPGLGNLHIRLAFNSSWSLLTALFSFRWAGNFPFYALNGFFTLICFGFLLTVQNQFLIHRNRLSAIVSVFLIVSLILFGTHGVASIDQDQPAMILLWMIFLLFIIRQSCNDRVTSNMDFVLVILSVFSITIKLSTLPVLLIPGFLLLHHMREGNRRFILVSLISCLFILLPWLLRNILLSGYLIFPYANLDVLDVDWKIPVQAVSNLQAVILAWARIPYMDMDKVLSMSASDWLPIWFNNNPRYLHYLLLIAVLGNSGMMIVGWKNKDKRINRLFLPGSFLLALTFWFSNAPDYRFGMGFLIPGAIYPVANIVNRLVVHASENGLKIIDKFLWFWTLLILSFTLSLSILYLPEDHSAWLRPAGYPKPIVHQQVVDGLSVYVPDRGEHCWDAPLPCTPYPQSGFLSRGSTLQEGFRKPSHKGSSWR
jgi:hypothetical protein